MIPLDERTVAVVRLLPVRETQTLTYLAKGLTTIEMGAMMGIAPVTVTEYIKRVYINLGVNTRAEAAVIACKCGLV